VKVRIRQVRWATCLLLTSLIVSIGCNNDPQYGVVTKPKDSPVAIRPMPKKQLPNQFRPADQKSDKLRGE